MEKRISAAAWDEDLTDEDLVTRLARLKDQVTRSMPIEDDDDLEGAIERAADTVASQQAGWAG